VAGDSVTFTSSDPAQSIGPVTDNGNGTYTVAITASTRVGDALITARDLSPAGTPASTAILTQSAVPATAIPAALIGPKRDVVRDLGIARHRLIQTAKNGDFAFPPDPIFLHAGDTLSAVAKLNVGPRRRLHGRGRAASVTTYGTGSITATHDGPAQLTIHATPAAKAALNRKGRVFASLHLAFRSSAKLGSTSTSKDFRLKLSKKRHK
jgi:hypothetical protein